MTQLLDYLGTWEFSDPALGYRMYWDITPAVVNSDEKDRGYVIHAWFNPKDKGTKSQVIGGISALEAFRRALSKQKGGWTRMAPYPVTGRYIPESAYMTLEQFHSADHKAKPIPDWLPVIPKSDADILREMFESLV